MIRGLNIGLDYGGVIDFNPGRWGMAVECAIEKQGHKVFIISHAQEGKDAEKREAFAKEYGAINLTFTDLKSGVQEKEIAIRKADLCKQYAIDFFIDDDADRAATISLNYHLCSVFYVHQRMWELGLHLLDSLGEP